VIALPQEQRKTKQEAPIRFLVMEKT
jgi:hypothetical protein